MSMAREKTIQEILEEREMLDVVNSMERRSAALTPRFELHITTADLREPDFFFIDRKKGLRYGVNYWPDDVLDLLFDDAQAFGNDCVFVEDTRGWRTLCPTFGKAWVIVVRGEIKCLRHHRRLRRWLQEMPFLVIDAEYEGNAKVDVELYSRLGWPVVKDEDSMPRNVTDESQYRFEIHILGKYYYAPAFYLYDREKGVKYDRSYWPDYVLRILYDNVQFFCDNAVIFMDTDGWKPPCPTYGSIWRIVVPPEEQWLRRHPKLRCLLQSKPYFSLVLNKAGKREEIEEADRVHMQSAASS